MQTLKQWRLVMLVPYSGVSPLKNNWQMRVEPRKVILVTILAGLAAYAVFDPRGERFLGGLSPSVQPEIGESEASAPGLSSSVAVEKGGRFALRERVPLGESQGSLFGARAWQPSASSAAAKPSAPAAPAMPYKFAGKLLQDGKLQVFLSKGDAVVPIREGETLDGTYRVESIGEDRITLVYLPLRHKETIPVFSLIQNGGAQARPVLQAAPSRGAPQVAQETPAPAPASSSPRRAPIPTASVVGSK